MSQEGRGTINVVEGPFEGQFGLWFVDSHDAQVISLVLLHAPCHLISLRVFARLHHPFIFLRKCWSIGYHYLQRQFHFL
jgi:hypothetical protein